MRGARNWLLVVVALLFGRARRRRSRERGRIVPEGAPAPRAELVVIALLLAAAAFAAGFVLVYALQPASSTQLMGIAIGLALACLAAALFVVGERLIVTEEREEDYPAPERPDEQAALVQIVRESGSRFTRRRLLLAATGTAGGAIGIAALAPVVSLGPLFKTGPLYETPWFRGRHLVDREGRRLRAADIEQNTFYTAYPAGADKDSIGSPIVLVRLPVADLKLPAGRDGWAPSGILAFSKICTHAACAVSLYRTPTFAPVQPRPALVCPCHYSTFDPAKGGEVIFGPAGRPLPQLPLIVGSGGALLAGGNFSAPVGPSWWGVRMGKAT